ncbi:MAG: hypothetical protein ACO3F0_01905 [Ilumatobacteraceae bacterium]
MAVTPVAQSRTEDVLRRLSLRRTGIDRLVESVRTGRMTLGEVFARAAAAVRTDVASVDGPTRSPSRSTSRSTAQSAEPSDASSEDAEVCSFVYLVKIAEAVPGIGKVKARRILEQHHLSERTRVGDVPLQVRALLVEALS